MAHFTDCCRQVEIGIKVCGFTVGHAKNENRQINAVITQFNALIYRIDGKPVNLALQSFSYFPASMAIGVRFDDRHYLGSGTGPLFDHLKIMPNSRDIDRQYRISFQWSSIVIQNENQFFFFKSFNSTFAAL